MKKLTKDHKTKEELLRDLRLNPEFKKKMEFVREKFFPALCAATNSIEDASTLLYGFNAQIMDKFLGLMKEKKMSDLGLYEKLDSGNNKYNESKALLDLFQDMDVFSAKEYIEGMRQEIETWKRDMFMGKKLEDIPHKWIDEL